MRKRISDKHQGEFLLSVGVNGPSVLTGKDILDVLLKSFLVDSFGSLIVF